jgi:hypothetical protein
MYINIIHLTIIFERLARMTDDNEKLKFEIYKRMQALDDEMNTILGMVNSFAFPRNSKRKQPICANYDAEKSGKHENKDFGFCAGM